MSQPGPDASIHSYTMVKTNLSEQESQIIIPVFTNEEEEPDEASIPRAVNFNTNSTPNLKNKNADTYKLVLTPNDSCDPSYTNLTLPYSVICRQRYRDAGAIQRKQFIKEIKQHELLQSKAIDGVRIHREFCNAILSQPKSEELVKLTQKQKARIEQILARRIEV